MRNLADFIYQMESELQNFTTWVHDSRGRYKKLHISDLDCKKMSLSDFLENQLNVVVEVISDNGPNCAYLLLPEINVAANISFDNGDVISIIDAKAA